MHDTAVQSLLQLCNKAKLLSKQNGKVANHHRLLSHPIINKFAVLYGQRREPTSLRDFLNIHSYQLSDHNNKA
jgi:hypothetical protein